MSQTRRSKYTSNRGLSESFKMSGALESYVNRPVSVITADGRNFVGTLKVSKRLFAQADSFNISGLWPDNQPDPWWDSRTRLQCNPGRGAGDIELASWFLTKFRTLGGLFDSLIVGCAGAAHCPGWQHLCGELSKSHTWIVLEGLNCTNVTMY